METGVSESAAGDETALEVEMDAPSSSARQCRPALRPGLLFRLHSENILVRAAAKNQRDRLLTGSMIDIYVGEQKRKWTLHRNLLSHHSELLESELDGHGKKKPNKLELLEYDPAGFELLVKWLYQGTLDDVSDLPDANSKYEYSVGLYKLYQLCERFGLDQLKNISIDLFRKGLNEAQLVPDADELNDFYKGSPEGSPFKSLMVKIAARQIMDPESDRDVNSYRSCFMENPSFAIELVQEIRSGTGGQLLNDPTDQSNDPCEFHDHEAGPNCHIKGKGKVKQAIKASARQRRDPKSSNSAQSAPSDPHHHPLHPQAQAPPQTPNPQPLPRQARLHDGVSAGPLRRRLTSPASSTTGMSTEHATASPPSPHEQRDKFIRMAPLEERPIGEAQQNSHRARDAHRPSSDGESRPAPNSSLSHNSPPSKSSDKTDERDKTDKEYTKADAKLEATRNNKADTESSSPEDTSPRRGLWDWARLGTGRMSIIGRRPQTEWRVPSVMISKNPISTMNGAPEGTAFSSLDDFSLFSSTCSYPNDPAKQAENAASKIEGLGLSMSNIDPANFSQTKRSSDDLVASMNGTPSPNALRMSQASLDGSEPPSPPTTPSPQPRKKEKDKDKEGDAPGDKPSPNRIPIYKIALASNILSPAMKASVV